MKIILTENIKDLGQVGDIREVKNGYARNFLVPRNLAILATAENLKKVENLKKEKEQKILMELEEMKHVSEQLKGLKLTIEAKTDEKGHLYAAVNSEKISEALKRERGIKVDPDYILTNEPIKKVGAHPVLFKYYDIEGGFEVEVVRV